MNHIYVYNIVICANIKFLNFFSQCEKKAYLIRFLEQKIGKDLSLLVNMNFM